MRLLVLVTLLATVATDGDFFSNESYPDLGIAAKEFPSAFIDESYPGHFTKEKIVTFKNFAGQCAFLLWQTGHEEFQPAK